VNREICEKRKVESLEEIPYGKGPTFAVPVWSALITAFNYLQRTKKMNIIVVCHAMIDKFTNPSTDSYNRYSLKLHKFASELLQEWSSEILFATEKIYTKQADQGFNRKETKAIGDGARVLYTSGRPSFIAKNRLQLPHEMPLDYAAFAEHLPS
jgi:hypothetical protein